VVGEHDVDLADAPRRGGAAQEQQEEEEEVSMLYARVEELLNDIAIVVCNLFVGSKILCTPGYY